MHHGIHNTLWLFTVDVSYGFECWKNVEVMRISLITFQRICLFGMLKHGLVCLLLTEWSALCVLSLQKPPAALDVFFLLEYFCCRNLRSAFNCFYISLLPSLPGCASLLKGSNNALFSNDRWFKSIFLYTTLSTHVILLCLKNGHYLKWNLVLYSLAHFPHDPFCSIDS